MGQEILTISRNRLLYNEILHLKPDAYFPMNERSGVLSLNHAAKNRYSFNGANANVTVGQPGKIGKAYSFNGSNSIITNGDGETNAITNDWAATDNKSILVIFKPGADAANNSNSQMLAIIRYLRMHIRNTTNDLTIRFDETSGHVASKSLGNGDRNWHIATGTYEYTGGTNATLKLMLDGVLVDSQDFTVLPTIPNTNVTGQIGMFNSVYLSASMQHLALFKRALSLGEHKKIARIGKFA